MKYNSESNVTRLIPILFIIGLLPISSVFNAFSRCKEYSFSVMPPSGPVPANCRFIIEGFGNGQITVESLKQGDAFLVSARGKIALLPERLHIGQYLISQIVLKPVEPLLTETIYSISVAGIDKKDLKIKQRDECTGWYSNGSIDIKKPAWNGSPVVISRKSINHGNDPAEWIQIKSAISEENSCYILVNLKNNVEKDFTRSYLLPIKNGMIYVGHGACCGPFNINSGYHYTAQLIPFDLAGNCNEKNASTVRFSEDSYPRNARYTSNNLGTASH